jgi:hypothetical protein
MLRQQFRKRFFAVNVFSCVNINVKNHEAAADPGWHTNVRVRMLFPPIGNHLSVGAGSFEAVRRDRFLVGGAGKNRLAFSREREGG